MHPRAPLLSIISFVSAALILSACGTGESPSATTPAATKSADDGNTPLADNPTVPTKTPTTTAPAPTGDSNTAAAAGFNLAVHGQDFTPHKGKNLFVGVVDANTKVAVVAHALIGNDATANVDFTKVLQAGHTYNIAYFADVNSDGACDKNDHQYLAKLPAETADANTTVSHNATMTQICAMLPTGPLP